MTGLNDIASAAQITIDKQVPAIIWRNVRTRLFLSFIFLVPFLLTDNNTSMIVTQQSHSSDTTRLGPCVEAVFTKIIIL